VRDKNFWSETLRKFKKVVSKTHTITRLLSYVKKTDSPLATKWLGC